MPLTRLTLSHLRNLDSVDISPVADLNIFYGDNGSGKTSLLEAIHIICRGTSFRSKSIRPIVQHNQKSITLFTELSRNDSIIPLGMERLANGGGRIRIAGKNTTRLADLLELIPIQFIGPDLQKVLEQGPKPRRNLLDWGVFHVEQNFHPTWNRYNKLLKQRNAALRKSTDKASICCWDHELIKYALQLTELRERYLTAINDSLLSNISSLLDSDVTYSFNRGWSKDHSIDEVLISTYESDRKRGYTQYGPQRADLNFFVDGKPVADKFSRGQLKLLVVAFKLAQVEMLNSKRPDQRCIFLMDDLPAELDKNNRSLVLSKLLDCNAQLFVTTTDSDLIDYSSVDSNKDKKMFHVERGLITEVVQ